MIYNYFNTDNKDYISRVFSGTKVNKLDVFNCEFPTTLYGYPLRHNFIGVTLIASVILIFLYEYPLPLLCTFPLYL